MTINIIFASSHQDRLAFWMKGLEGVVSTISIVDRSEKLEDEIARIKPQVLLLDFEFLDMNFPESVAVFRRVCSETKTIVMNVNFSEEMEWDLMKAGVRGCCRWDANQEYIAQVVMAVHNGEMWTRRSMTSRLIDELGKTSSKNKAYRATLGLLNKLTQREYDIAIRAGKGESNKEIAQSCGITERTVKAHLSEIYNKLGVADRLNLALALSADNRNAYPNTDSKADSDIAQHMQLSGSRFNDKANHNQ